MLVGIVSLARFRRSVIGDKFFRFLQDLNLFRLVFKKTCKLRDGSSD